MQQGPTTLEIVGAVNSEDLKAGEGNTDILSFFALVSSAFFINEKKKASSEELSSKTFSIYDKIITQYKKLHIESLLKKHDDIKEKFDGATSGNIHILDQNLQNNCLVIHSYSSEQQDKANARYSTLEKEAQQTPDIRNIVLTKADSLDNLKRAYPNYFINPNGFIEEIKKMKDAISERKASLRTSKKMRIVMWLVIIAWTLVLSYVILT